ncbi:GTP pyrophosphokinase [Pseudoalteromonas rhizosphaerae]|uniref:GTP pyrophosphokinase family protein n=1 Tax=Pseudoalteromonas rhizosphaerae TaxID=2518973 RepID=A0ABW8L2N7_9GAMM
MNIPDLKTEFDKLRPSYMRLAENVKAALIQFLNEQNLDFVEIETRVKEFDSFVSKIERKGYKDPLVEITDICGLRIINYYPSDLKSIEEILKNEFDLIESSNKEEEMEDDRFGYRSFHFIATIKEEWLNAPNYRGLKNLKFEIQARTILMHGWAAISHKLSYKHERDVPKKFRRDLFRLSALFELADEQFERLRLERKTYSESFIEPDSKGENQFIPRDKLNTDSLQALLNYYFPDREKSNDISELVSEITSLEMDLVDYNSAVRSVITYLDEIEKEENAVSDTLIKWAQLGAARTVLDLTNDNYFKRHKGGTIPEELLEVVENWREKIGKNS